MGEAVSVSDVTLPNSFPKVRSGWRCHLHGATYKTGGCWPGRGLGWLLLSPSFVFLLLRACWQPNPARTPGWQLPGTALAVPGPGSGRPLPCLGRARDGPSVAAGKRSPWAGGPIRTGLTVVFCPSGLEQRLLHRVGDYADQRNSGEGESASTIWSQ